MDLAGSMLKACRKRCHHSIEAHRLALVEAEASELPFGEKSVDAVFSNLVLQWVQDFSAVMEQVSTVLKPGGDFWFATLVSGTLSELRQSWLAVDDLPHVNSFLTCEQIMEAVLQSGLHLVKTGCEPTVMRYDTVKALMSDLKNIGAGNRHREARRGLTGKTAFQTMQREYEAFRDKEGALPATYEVFYVHAKRIFETETG
jgi:malonyl-CoA O-methyltransferase